jgi:MoaA/NifB/PqqE/SkfB family radical SAM enzyme
LGANGWYVTPSMNWAGSAKDSASVKPTGKAYSGCLFPWVLVNVSQTGIVTPCCIDAELSNAVGDLNKEGLRHAWNGESMQRLRRALLHGDLATLGKISNCAKCSRLYRSQNAYALNRARIEWAQLRYFLGQR